MRGAAALLFLAFLVLADQVPILAADNGGAEDAAGRVVDVNSGVGSGYSWVLDLMGVGISIILYLRVASAPEPYRDEFGCDFSFAPAGDSMGI
jgi:hypothetical protein